MGISKRKRRSGEMHLQLCVHPSLSAFMSVRLPNTLQDTVLQIATGDSYFMSYHLLNTVHIRILLNNVLLHSLVSLHLQV